MQDRYLHVIIIEEIRPIAEKRSYYIMPIHLTGSPQIGELDEDTMYSFSFINIYILIMNKVAIVEAVHAKIGGTKVQAEQAVETMIETIVTTLKKGGEVSIAGLGIFSTKLRAARQARNPRTGETIQVASMRVPKFRAAKALKDAVK